MHKRSIIKFLIETQTGCERSIIESCNVFYAIKKALKINRININKLFIYH